MSVYNCDRSLDSLDVYNADNLFAWVSGSDTFTTVNNQATDTTTTTTPVTTPAVTTGWVKATDGTWTYNKADGTKATGWLNDNGTWYNMKADGTMATGWYNDEVLGTS